MFNCVGVLNKTFLKDQEKYKDQYEDHDKDKGQNQNENKNHYKKQSLTEINWKWKISKDHHDLPKEWKTIKDHPI